MFKKFLEERIRKGPILKRLRDQFFKASTEIIDSAHIDAKLLDDVDKAKLDNANCIEIESGYPTKIGFKLSGLIKKGKVRTYDMGGDATTLKMAEAIASKIS